jgi:NAD(P)-dependent dehydrogenase (short-subunit alcohol dehydrogenase family)
MSENRKIWFITGISRGLGLELAKAVLAEGDVVIGTTRDGNSALPSVSHRLHLLPLELPSANEVKRAIVRAHALHGRLDVVVNNAGYGLLGAIEEAAAAEVRRVFEVNFFGPLQVIQAALPFLRAQRRGHIVNISSIAGLAPLPGSGIYAATKFALEGLSESLAKEVGSLGIRVTLVEPGALRTDFLSAHSMRTASGSIAAYAETSGKTVHYLREIAGQQPGDPVRAARAIIEAVEAKEPPLHLVLGSDALRRARVKFQHLSEEVDRWEPVSLGTDFAAQLEFGPVKTMRNAEDARPPRPASGREGTFKKVRR